MNRELLLEAMNHIDPALIEEADRPMPEARRVSWRRPAIIAACLCLILAGTAVAMNSSRVRLTWFESGEEVDEFWGEDAVYTVSSEINFYPLDNFSEEITAPELVNTGLLKPFATWEQMEEYIGFDIWNNPALDAADRGVTISGYMEMEERPTNILLWASYHDNGLCEILADSSYCLDNVYVLIHAGVYTEEAQGKMQELSDDWGYMPVGGMLDSEKLLNVSMKELYATPSGLETTITQCDFDLKGDTLKQYCAYFSINGIPITVSAQNRKISCKPEEFPELSAHTLEVLKEVLDGFEIEPMA